LLLDGLEAYCVAPDIRDPDSCFHRQEAAAAENAVQALAQQELPAVLETFVREREGMGAFLWRCPQREGKPCTSETCLHGQDEPPGFVAVAQPGGRYELACMHEACGEAAQEALVDWEALERRREEQRRQAALNRLRRLSVTHTLLAPEGEGIDLSTRSLLEAIEPVLVPDWDVPVMFHVVLGWQAAVRAQIAEELGVEDAGDAAVTHALADRHEGLAERPAHSIVRDQFSALRDVVTETNDGLHRWITCLALVRTWRDEVETIDSTTETIQQIEMIGLPHLLHGATHRETTPRE
jgi:hypothetical protein